ncbi:MAG: DUF2202 domain-containing protein [Spirochaetia bacterium]|nr:DUF2202 domain-containing protein [Spirochaetia bacterium]MCF7940761.1 DUF2202 domain-containing protein [Spirochaetia bacterium]
MKRITAITALLLLMIFSIAAQGTTEYTEEITGTESPTEDLSVYDGLSAAEVEGLLLMREEEKLARDVYDALADIWNLRAFSNIAGSEQTHMDAVGRVLATYGIPDPVTDDTPGVFTDAHLQSLYDELVEQGSISAAEAYSVGAMIEDLDIKDLQELMDETENELILMTYASLLRGSENHMRSFTRGLSRYGITYSAQFITDEELSAILMK